MALGKCPECAGSLSSTAKTCPHCGNTRFTAPTGNTRKGRCPSCEGAGVTWYEADSYPMSHYSTCDNCKSTGAIDLVESKNLVDGSLLYREQTPTVAVDYSALPLGPPTAMTCPGCSASLVYMRTDVGKDGSEQHVYRCGRREKGKENKILLGCPGWGIDPCTEDVFRLSRDGLLVRTPCSAWVVK